MANFNVIIPVGGYSQRLNGIYKCLLPIDKKGNTLIQKLIYNLINYGIKKKN